MCFYGSVLHKTNKYWSIFNTSPTILLVDKVSRRNKQTGYDKRINKTDTDPVHDDTGHCGFFFFH